MSAKPRTKERNVRVARPDARPEAGSAPRAERQSASVERDYRSHEIPVGDRDWAVPSNAAVAKHPIHPMLIPLPISFLLGAFAADLATFWSDDAFWPRAALWLTGAGVVTGLVAAIPGIIDFTTIKRVRDHRAAWIHGLGNVVAMILSGISWALRIGDPAAAVRPWGLTLSTIVALILVVTGWLGGELSYRHRIGVLHDES
jgi:uncharacterized membrane protein